MDTISRENNSYLPVAGLIAGVLALVLAIVALAKTGSLKTIVDGQADKVAKIEDVEKVARDALTTANNVKATAAPATAVNDALAKVADALAMMKADLVKVQEAAAKPKAATGSTGPVVAGKDEYVVKQGDIGSTVAKATGFTTAQIAAVNPGLDWTKLKVGQKLKLPAKK
jgi:LysM repeat protein